MAVNVWTPKEKKKEPLDRLVTLTSIGANVANMTSKAGSVQKPSQPVEDFNSYVPEQPDVVSDSPKNLDESIFAKEQYDLTTPMGRRLKAIKLGDYRY